MLDVKEVKELLKDETLSDKEATEIRDVCQVLADLILDQWFDNIRNERIAAQGQERNKDGRIEETGK